MKDYIDYMIDNKQAMYRARTAEKTEMLVSEIYKKIGVRLSKKLTVKILKSILNQK